MNNAYQLGSEGNTCNKNNKSNNSNNSNQNNKCKKGEMGSKDKWGNNSNTIKRGSYEPYSNGNKGN